MPVVSRNELSVYTLVNFSRFVAEEWASFFCHILFIFYLFYSFFPKLG